jgi:hypothetical protein
VVMGTEKKQVVSSELYKYLGFKDFRTIESGDTVFYVMGKYNNITDAVNREKDLKDKGFTSDGIIQQDNKDKTVNTLDKNEINALLNAEKDSSGTTALTNTNYVQPFYRVQIGAYSKRLPANVFKDVPNLVYVTGEDGVTRYYSGYFTDLKSAADHRVDLYGMGYKKSFIAAFKDGKRVTLQDAGATLVDPNNPDVIDKNDVLTNKVEAKDVKFKINLGEYSSDVPAEVLDVFLEIGNVTPRRSKTGKIMYVTGEYSSFEEAEKVRKTLAARGIANAALVGEFKGRIITADEAKTLLGK